MFGCYGLYCITNGKNNIEISKGYPLVLSPINQNKKYISKEHYDEPAI